MSAPTPESIRDLVAGYALDALTPEERQAFEAALASSPELARELREHREVMALLARPTAVNPSPELKSRLMSQIGATKVTSIADRRPRPAPRLPIYLALAAMVLLSIGLGLKVKGLQLEIDRPTQSTGELTARADQTEAKLKEKEAALNTIMTGGDVEMVQLSTTGKAPAMRVFLNRRMGKGVIAAFDLPAAPSGKVYQLWLLKGGKPMPSITFNTDASGTMIGDAFDLPAEEGLELAAVTVEPAGGSTTPTMPIVMSGKISGE